ncbi:RNA-directed DNA polymerase [Allopusillimonas soli]|uniref:RNA-directed DNA polymerase n=1 Tax=Allopusillimonas soli TaxID=659016 RepID=A0A853FGZ3_9BURK|nr:RNA-directed DNA polymerase [Allopusillimonas soli]NYT38912.1 RNA-directed DNA polymerase [Allopusillimonas soli]TEA70090.1 RNA-directed DNA polymerase [Allopusillimonas soli]
MDTSPTFPELVQAYFDCRRHKRTTDSALRFEQRLEQNLSALHEQLLDGSYRPGKSICFVITRPKPREVWAAQFRDRIVHHLLYNRIAARFQARFIADSCACIPGRGTLYAAKRLEAKIRSQTQNWSRAGYFLKADLANFFVSIDKRLVWFRLAELIPEDWWRNLAALILFHDPRENVEVRGSKALLKTVPRHKRLMEAPEYHGLPIGNLSSQFFANVLLDSLDQHVKHHVRARHYVRYVDDIVLLSESPGWLLGALDSIERHLPGLGLALNPRKTVIQPIARGVDFAGYVIKPWRREVRRRSVRTALARMETVPPEQTLATANSYMGLMRHASARNDRARIANAARRRGHCVATHFTKAYKRGHPAQSREDLA